MRETNRKIYEFDDFRLDVFQRQLLKNLRPVSIPPKAFDLLVALVESNGSLIERESLYSRVWPETIVEEANLNVHISKIRKALEEPSCISTVSGYGYRFTWSVSEVNGRNGRAGPETNGILPESSTSGEAEPKLLAQPGDNLEAQALEPEAFTKHVASNRNSLIAGIIGVLVVTALGVGSYFYYGLGSAKQIESIAVMPFVNESGDPDKEYISDGITETLIGGLSQLSGLSVKAPTSVFRYKGKNVDARTVGRELDVQVVLNGRVVQRGDDLMLYLSLVDAKTENQIWGKQYNRKVIDLVSLQRELAQDVAGNLKAKLSGTEEQKLAKTYSPNPEAYQLYLKGRFHWNMRPRKDSRAIEYFSQAVTLDPNYALAYAGLADAYADTGMAFTRERLSKGREAAEKAVKLDNGLSEAHASLANILMADYEFRGAEREFQRSIELNPNYALAHQLYGVLLRSLGRFDEAISEHQRSIEIDPLMPVANNSFGRTLLTARRYDEAIAQFEKVIELHPGNNGSYYGAARAYAAKGDYAQFAEYVARHWEARGLNEYAGSMRKSFATGGFPGSLRVMIQHGLDGHLPAYDIATAYCWLGDNDGAFDQLNRSLELREPPLATLKVDERFDALRDDPRYAELVRKIGFPE